MKLFQYAVILHPTEEEKKNGGTSTLILGVETVLAQDHHAAVIQAAQKIPKEHMDKIDRMRWRFALFRGTGKTATNPRSILSSRILQSLQMLPYPGIIQPIVNLVFGKAI